MNCDQAKTEMIAYLKDELDEARKGRFEEHIAACPACRHELEGARRLLAWTDAASEENVAKLVKEIIDDAISGSASDIHFEPQRDNTLLVRYRIDGVMHEMRHIDPLPRQGVVTRLKMLGGLTVSETSNPQDGRIKWTSNDKEYDLRINSMPFIFGEGLVLGIFDRTSVFLGLDRLGFSEDNTRDIRELLHQPNGLILVTGPTGSGKTTTMYSMLQEIVSPSTKIMTIEDPVEYVLTGVNHAQVHKKVGFTFAAALRSFMRHDPDIIMVGATRDLETAELELQAVITGHLVLATLHTNDAPLALFRLVDMGVEPFMVAASVTGVVSQRLARRVCQECKTPYELKASELRRFGFQPENPDETLTLYRGKGCEACRHTGFKHRIGLYEVMTMNDEMTELLLRRAAPTELREAAKRNGMRELREDGLRKVLDGITTPEEAMRVSVTFPM